MSLEQTQCWDTSLEGTSYVSAFSSNPLLTGARLRGFHSRNGFPGSAVSTAKFLLGSSSWLAVGCFLSVLSVGRDREKWTGVGVDRERGEWERMRGERDRKRDRKSGRAESLIKLEFPL